MKSPANDERVLWQLIKSLSPAERKQFTQQEDSRRSGKSLPIYVKVFNWACQHEKPDENTLLKELSPELNKKNLSYTRHYLQNRLIDSLAQQEEKRGGQAVLILRVPLIRRFFQQGQHALAIQLWKKTLSLARKMEDFVLIKLLKDEYLYFEMYLSRTNSYSNLIKIYNDQIAESEVFFQVFQLEDLCFRSILIRKKAHFALSTNLEQQLNKLASHPLLKKNPGVSPFARYHFWLLTHGIISYLHSDFEETINHLEPLIKQWHKRPDYISYHSEAYLEVLFTYTYAAIHLRKFRKVEALYQHTCNKQIKDRFNINYFNVLRHLSFLRICHKEGNYAGVSGLLKKLRPFANEWRAFLQPDIQRPLSMAISYFVLDNFQEADGYARQALLFFQEDVRSDQARVTHLLLLLICYEMKNEWTFDNQYKACYQYFYRNKFISNFEKDLMNALKKTFPYRRNEKNLELLNSTLNRLNLNKTRIKEEVCHIFNFPGWIASRIEGKIYRNWVQEKLGGGNGGLSVLNRQS